jgi:uncharacterized protein YraI
MTKLSRSLLAATALLILTTLAAEAAPAVTRGPARLHDGPSANFPVIAVIPPGVEVDVAGCSNGWCQVLADEGEGFVRDRQLDFYDPPPVVVFPPLVYEFGWSGWHRRYPGEWERWHRTYPRRHFREEERRRRRPDPIEPGRSGPGPMSPGAPTIAPPPAGPRGPGGGPGPIVPR